MKKLKSILLVDDDEATNYFNTIILEDLEVTEHIQVVKNGKQALDYMLQQGEYENISDYISPELIFLDINMPRMNGFEFLAEFKNQFKSDDIPLIVMLTTSLNDEDKEKVREYEAVKGFINKPLRINYITDILKEFFPESIN